MQIAATMSLNDLLERMDVNGEGKFTEAQAKAMRTLILRDAPAYGWQKTGDIEDADWFRMLDEAINA